MKKYTVFVFAIMLPIMALATCPDGYITIKQQNVSLAKSCDNKIYYGSVDLCATSVGSPACAVKICSVGFYVDDNYNCKQCPGMQNANGSVVYGTSSGTGGIDTCYLPAGTTNQFLDGDGHTYILMQDCDYQ